MLSSDETRADFAADGVIVCAVVLYNRLCEDAKSLAAWTGPESYGYMLHVYDNGTIPGIKESNRKYCADRNLPYTDMMGNRGLSAAYNAAVSELPETGRLLLLDQDTTLPEDFFPKLNASIKKYPDVPVHVPVVRSRTGILSPASIRGHRVGRLKDIAPGIYTDITAINSGMTVQSRAYKSAGAYAEDYFLDYIDHEFIRRYRKTGGRIAVFDATLTQDFSDDDHKDRESDLVRFAIYSKDMYAFCSDTFGGRMYFCAKIFYRALKLDRIHHCGDFLKIAMKRERSQKRGRPNG